MPPWFHFGYRLDDAVAVTAPHARMAAAGVTHARPLYEDADLVSFRCADPDGFPVEIYWERSSPPADR